MKILNQKFLEIYIFWVKYLTIEQIICANDLNHQINTILVNLANNRCLQYYNVLMLLH